MEKRPFNKLCQDNASLSAKITRWRREKAMFADAQDTERIDTQIAEAKRTMEENRKKMSAAGKASVFARRNDTSEIRTAYDREEE